MVTTTLSTRITREESEILDTLAEETGMARSNLVKTLLRRGMKELRMDVAAEAYAQHRVTLSRAAEIGGLSLWDFIAQMGPRRLDLHYDVAELAEDLQVFHDKK